MRLCRCKKRGSLSRTSSGDTYRGYFLNREDSLASSGVIDPHLRTKGGLLNGMLILTNIGNKGKVALELTLIAIVGTGHKEAGLLATTGGFNANFNGLFTTFNTAGKLTFEYRGSHKALVFGSKYGAQGWIDNNYLKILIGKTKPLF